MVFLFRGENLAQEDIDSAKDVFFFHVGSAEGNHVGVVVFPTFSGDDIVVSDAATNAFHFIRHHHDTFSRCADDDAEIDFALRDGFGRFFSEQRVIAASQRIRPEITRSDKCFLIFSFNPNPP